ncbi:protein S100-A13-like [Astyanax mexicanus]|uniref:Protein S100-A13-like n=1 Tax=Astyanax mexicanus TaxID=7994 RepID=A0A8B9LXT8_ASTMX|nr:protein S100-A13-like [Astyanax mexicanus]
MEHFHMLRVSRHHAVHSKQNSLPTMESAINVLVSQFKTYAGKDSSAHTLTKEEFQSLVVSQLPNLVKNATDPAVIDQLMSSLDENNDGELTFQEFWQLIGTLASRHAGYSK